MRRCLKAALITSLIPLLVVSPASAEVQVFSPQNNSTASPSVPSLTAQTPSTGKSWANARPVLTLPISKSSQVAFSPDGQSLASIGSQNDKTIRLWNLKTGQPIRTLVNEGEMSSIRFILDGKNLIDL